MTAIKITTSIRSNVNTIQLAAPLDGDGRVLHEGDRVYSYDYDKNFKPLRCYGTLHKNEEHPNVSEWYIAYDDGQECAVLEMSLVFKA